MTSAFVEGDTNAEARGSACSYTSHTCTALDEILQKHKPNLRNKVTIDAQVKTKSKRKVQGVPQSQTAALLRPQEEEETDKSKQAQTEQTYEKH